MFARMSDRTRGVPPTKDVAASLHARSGSDAVPSPTFGADQELDALTRTPPEPISVRLALQDYWNEWAGVLMFVGAEGSSVNNAMLTAKSIISGGNLIRHFEARFHRAELADKPDELQSQKIQRLNALADHTNQLWHSGKASADVLATLADQAYAVIYTNNNVESA